ncbi:GGDEF domain-containing protein [Spongisporangium articulatum]|uniref:GGDEF domain-containing protein n=1 Tax=Spongisporangium articulatum TaxID=3362603 RepID=A0ABW8AQU5_9ACTN
MKSEARAPITPLTYVALLGLPVGTLLAAVSAFLPGVYRPEGRPWLVGACVLLMLPVPVIHRRREADSTAPIYLTVALVTLALCGYFAVDESYAVALLNVFGIIGLTAAVRLSVRSTWKFLVLAVGLATPVTVIRVGVDTAGLTLLALIVTMTVLPGLTVLYFRRQLESAVQAAQRAAETDPLTGLLNRRGLAERVPALLDQATAAGGNVAVLAIDLDHFKRVNDAYGHAVGDDVLRRVAHTVRGSVRDGDVVARIGGEEFCVLAVLPTTEGADHLAERIRRTVEHDAGAWGMTVSAGGVQVRPDRLGPAPGGDPVERIWTLLDRADVLLYEAKDAGRNVARVVVAV